SARRVRGGASPSRRPAPRTRANAGLRCSRPAWHEPQVRRARLRIPRPHRPHAPRRRHPRRRAEARRTGAPVRGRSIMSNLRALPPVHEIAARLAADGAPAALCAEAARVAIDEQRAAMLAAARCDPAPKDAAALADGALTDAITARAQTWLAARQRPALAPAINATGVLLHTGLGRAPLAPEVAEALGAAAAGYTPVEIDMKSGQRGRRGAIVEPLLTRLTGAEAATVVNNNAAAVTIAIRAVATPARPTVIVSRGELVEIGGAFRLPEIIEAAGAKLREVGTTNRTRLADYERAIDGETCALLKVHPSNFRIE